AIEDIKKIVLRNSNQPMQRKITAPLKQTITEQQTLIVRMRCEENRSFDVIAKQPNLSPQQVHQEFATAYKLSRQQEGEFKISVMKKTMKLTRKIQIVTDLPSQEERKEVLDTLYRWQNRCFRAANLIVTHLYVQEMIKDFLYLSEGV